MTGDNKWSWEEVEEEVEIEEEVEMTEEEIKWEEVASAEKATESWNWATESVAMPMVLASPTNSTVW